MKKKLLRELLLDDRLDDSCYVVIPENENISDLKLRFKIIGRRKFFNNIVVTLYTLKVKGVVRLGGSDIKIIVNENVSGIYQMSCFDLSYVNIGKGTTSRGISIETLNSSFETGSDCMFSDGITIQSTDSHGLVDIKSMTIYNNNNKKVILGKHVWLSRNVTVVGSVKINDGAVIGINSTITKDIPKFSLAVGSPAKIVKSAVTWSRHVDKLDLFCNKIKEQNLYGDENIMAKTAFIGGTGFVGSNLLPKLTCEPDCFNSKNIKEIHNSQFDILYVSAIQAKKWWANQNAFEDKSLIDELFSHLEKVTAKKVVFISTVDVYQPPLNADEDTLNDTDIHAYGSNRLYAEDKIKALFEDVHIIRLQGLVANNLTKNVIFDLKNKNILESINPASSLQWYPLNRLYSDIEKVIEHNIPLINLSVEPIKTKQIIDIAPLTKDEKAIVSTKPANVVSYDVKSKYAHLLGGNNGYVVSEQESLAEIRNYFNL